MRVLFLPGAGGSADFWRPVAGRLPPAWEKVHLNWPGAGNEQHDSAIASFDDLVTLAAAALEEPPTHVVAQSLGGIVAIGLALRHPATIDSLVLAATSGGIPMTGADWRNAYRAEYPHAAPWITGPTPDHAEALPRVTAPTLLLWGERDPISPPAAGRRLRDLLPQATLHVLPTGDHGFGRSRPELVASLIEDHINAS